jgi:hypothetical protein
MNRSLVEFKQGMKQLMLLHNVELLMSMEYVSPNDNEATPIYRFSIPGFKDTFEIDDLIEDLEI